LAGRGQADAAVAHFQKALSLASAQKDKRLTEAIQTRIKRLQPDTPAAKAQP
jgi:BioD-like phosphotransacetylase family protein